MPRAPVSQVMLLMNKMIENAGIESNEKFQRQKMLHKLLMLELGNANNLQQGKRGAANELSETNDRNVEISTRTACIEPKITANGAVQPDRGPPVGHTGPIHTHVDSIQPRAAAETGGANGTSQEHQPLQRPECYRSYLQQWNHMGR